MFQSSNPTLNDKVFQFSHTGIDQDVMTIDGTINKSLISIAITMATGYWAFTQPQLFSFPVLIGLVVCTIAISLGIYFKKSLAPTLTPIYALVEGLFLGAVTHYFEADYPGIAFQAMGLTTGILLGMLMLYKSETIRATDNFKKGMFSALAAVGLFYLISIAMTFFGVNVMFLHDGSLLSIGISLAIVVIASLSLILDFDLIEQNCASGTAPKYMEWYGAFALLVTLVWLYLELLKLLSKLNSRD